MMSKTIVHFVTLAICLLHVVLPGSPANLRAEEAPLVREILVPYEALQEILAGSPEHIFLDAEEYADLISKAKQSPVLDLPHEVLLLAADYSAVVQDQRVLVRGTLTFELLQSGLHAVPLPMAGVGIRQASVAGEPAALARNELGQITVFLQGQKTKTLDVELVAPLQTTVAQQSMSLFLPTPAATRFEIEVPGNVELKKGAAVVNRRVDAESNVTRFELLPPRRQMELVFSLNNRQLNHQRVVLSRAVIVDEVTQSYERIHGNYSMQVLHGAVDVLRFRLPPEFEVNSVEAPLLSRWQVTPPLGDETSQILEVTFQEPTSGNVVIGISATRSGTVLEEWQFPRVEAVEVDSQAAVVGLLVEERLESDTIRAEQLIEIDTETLRAALPETVFQAEPGAPRLRPVVAYYAPRNKYQLRARFLRPEAALRAESSQLLTLDDQQAVIAATVRVSADEEAVFAVDLSVPDGWNVGSLVQADGQPLQFDRLDGRVHVRFPHGIVPGQPQSMTFQATYTPQGWLDDWQTREIMFPAFRVLDAHSQSGAIAIEVHEDFVLEPSEIEDLVPLDEKAKIENGLQPAPGQIAFRHEEAEFGVKLVVRKTPPHVRGRVFDFFRFEPLTLHSHYELIYDVQRARARTLQFRLPLDTPKSVRISGMDGVQLKQYRWEDEDEFRTWIVTLSEARKGVIRLRVDFEQRLAEEEPKGLELPLVHLHQAAYDSSVVAVEGNAEFDVNVQTEGRRLDVGELVDAEYKVSRRLLGVFGFGSFAGDVRVDIERRAGYGLPEAIVQRAELVTIVGANGITQTAIRYQLRTKASYLQFTLPRDAELWSAAVDRSPASPQRDLDELLISLPPADKVALRDVQLVYQVQGDPAALWHEIQVEAPRLVVRGQQDVAGYEVPMADLAWHLVLPDGQRVVRTGGTVTGALRLTEMPVFDLGKSVAAGIFGFSTPLAPRARVAQDAQTASPAIAHLYDIPAAMEGTTGEAPAERADGESESLSRAARRPSLSKQVQESRNLADAEEAQKELAQLNAPQALGEVEPQQQAAARQIWALEGVRSLQIDLDRSGTNLSFQSLGNAPRLEASILNQTRLEFLSATLAVGVFLIGLGAVRQSTAIRFRLLLLLLVTTLLLPMAVTMLAGWDVQAGLDEPFYAAALLIPFYAGLAVWNTFSKLCGLATNRLLRFVPLLLLVLVVFDSPASAQDLPAGISWEELLKGETKLELPSDAIIIPYDPSAPGRVHGDRVLVPLNEYRRLWKLAFPEATVDPPPVGYALSGAQHRAELRDERSLTVSGRIHIEVFAEGNVSVPLPLGNGVLTRITLDDQPAKVRLVTPKPAQAPAGKLQNVPSPASQILTLVASGPANHVLEFEVQLPISRSGGWRMTSGVLPSAPATSLTARVPTAATEVLLSGAHDRVKLETREDDQSVTAALNAEGHFRLQWRPTVSVGQVDHSLVADSVGLLDIQEDGVVLWWRLNLSFRQMQRESFTLQLPEDYLVEAVEGANVRSWNVANVEDQQRVEITLLQAANQSESFLIRISRNIPLASEATELLVPIVSTPDAVLHRGQLLVRRSPLLEVRTRNQKGVRRVDTDVPKFAPLLERANDESPLGLKSHQGFQFTSEPFSIQLGIRPFQAQATVLLQTLLKVSERKLSLETRLNYDVQQRPLYVCRIRLPAGLEIQGVTAPGLFEWAVTGEGDDRDLTIYLKTGQRDRFALVVTSEQEREAGGRITVPAISVEDVESQRGQIVVQADPSFHVRTEQLQDCETILLSRVSGWLDAKQRRLSRLALAYRNPDFTVRLQISLRQPRVSSYTISNVRVTPREIQETVYVEFRIGNAGVREVSFLLPDWMREAEVMVPLLRRKIVEDVEGNPDYVRIRLQLQDEIMDRLIVVAQQDRALGEGDQKVPLPIVETGRSGQRYIVIENAGRDEIFNSEVEGFEALQPQQADWRRLASVLGDTITEAHVARSGDRPARFLYRTRERATVQTAEARIRLSETTLLVDAHGAYRGKQVYHVDNKTEPYLEIVLPAASQLWTAIVAGEPVKPIRVADQVGDRQVLIPLIKTAPGDLDYEVVLKYGGTMPRPEFTRRVRFPLMTTVNIHVEQSQVRLQLPETHRWVGFTGTMKQVTDKTDLVAGYLAYKTKQVEDLRRVLSASTNEFTKIRAANNLNQLDQALSRLQSRYRQERGNVRLQQELRANYAALEDAREQAQAVEQEATVTETWNRDLLVFRCAEQTTVRSLNVVDSLGDNFRADAVQVQETAPQLFNSKWFLGNGLQAKSEAAKKVQSRLDLDAEASSPASNPQRAVIPNFQDAKDKTEYFGRMGVRGAKPNQQPEYGDELKGQVRRYQQQLEMDQRHLEENRNRGESLFFQAVPRSSLSASVEREESDALPLAGFAAISTRDTALASLDVQLPDTGQVYLFTTPRGEIEIEARAVETKSVFRFVRIAWIFGGVLVLLVAARCVRWINRKLSRTMRAAVLVCGGVVSLFLLPVLGILLIAIGIVLFAQRWTDDSELRVTTPQSA